MILLLLLSAVTVRCWADATTELEPFKCGLALLPCKDERECVLHIHWCDGETDCQDGSDEDDCPEQCQPDQFQCSHGRMCIDQKEVCDGVAHCQDRSDELNCWNPSESCAHMCDGKSRCIPASFICDGETDCIDGTDEVHCSECAKDEFRCTNGQCLPVTMHCDGQADCPDHSDEIDCNRPFTCPQGQKCLNSNQCLLPTWVCDGEQDCNDGQDEKDCHATSVTCGKYQWACSSGAQCLPMSWRCDGVEDCSDAKDEVECVPTRCPSHQFRCATGQCVDADLVCNGVSDCSDGSDEGGTCSDAKCSAPGSPLCTHKCYSTPQGLRCSCSVGFELQLDNVTCLDVNECEAPGSTCSHACVNTDGSFKCRCAPGYLLQPDGHSCEITGTSGEPLLLVSTKTKLILLNLQSSSLNTIPAHSKKTIMWVDYDWKEQKVFWVDLEAESICWSFLNQADRGVLVKGIRSDGIAVDWVGRNLYWINGIGGQIHAIALDGTSQNTTVVLDEDLEQPRSLALMPQKGLMFWSEIGSESRIERAGMDGSERRIVVQEGLSWPGGLAVDSLGGRIYWTDEKLRCIGSATLEGDNVQFLQLSQMRMPFSVDVFDAIYWSDTERRTIQSADKFTGKNYKTLLKQTDQPFGLKVVHQALQQDVSNPCLTVHCSHICLLAPGASGVCRCPSGLLLGDDGLSCSAPDDSAFLLLLSPTSVTQLYLRSLHEGLALRNWPEHHLLLLPKVNDAAELDYVPQDLMLYVLEAGRPSVLRFKLKGGEAVLQKPALQLQENDVVTAMAVDWVTRNVYWSSHAQPGMHVTSARGAHTALLLGERGPLGSIVLHPTSGHICFTAAASLGPPNQMECGFMDGRSLKILWSGDVVPISLTFSSDGQTVFWVHRGTATISSIRIDGSGYKEFQADVNGIRALTYSDNRLFWANTLNGNTTFWFNEDMLSNKLWFMVISDVVSLKAFSKNGMKGTNACSEGNGGCTQLCLPHPGGRSCRCALDHHLVSNTHCVPVTDCPDGPDGDCAMKPTLSPPESHTQPKETTPKDDTLLRELDAPPCDIQMCNGQGRCVGIPDGVVVCECHVGFSGKFCQDASGLSRKVLLSAVVAAVVGSTVIIAVVVGVIRKKVPWDDTEWAQ